MHKTINLPTALGLGVCLALLIGMRCVAADSAASEYAVKAAIVHKIAKFVTWPTGHNESLAHALSICLPEADPIGPSIEALSGKVVQGRIIEVLRLSEVNTPATECEILYLGRPASEENLGLISRVADAPVLTIGDSRAFANSGGIVFLDIKQGQVHFEISVGASHRAGLGISAQLLQLARVNE